MTAVLDIDSELYETCIEQHCKTLSLTEQDSVWAS